MARHCPASAPAPLLRAALIHSHHAGLQVASRPTFGALRASGPPSGRVRGPSQTRPRSQVPDSVFTWPPRPAPPPSGGPSPCRRPLVRRPRGGHAGAPPAIGEPPGGAPPRPARATARIPCAESKCGPARMPSRLIGPPWPAMARPGPPPFAICEFRPGNPGLPPLGGSGPDSRPGVKRTLRPIQLSTGSQVPPGSDQRSKKTTKQQKHRMNK